MLKFEINWMNAQSAVMLEMCELLPACLMPVCKNGAHILDLGDCGQQQMMNHIVHS